VRDLTVPSQPPVLELFVVVAGWPGSGKSTLAAALAAEMRLPLLAKDEIKEALMDGRLVEVHCIVPVEVARSRYRARTGQRHAGHLDQARTEDELWGTPPRPLGLGPVLNIDTCGQLDIPGSRAL
jgi:predicted kinase